MLQARGMATVVLLERLRLLTQLKGAGRPFWHFGAATRQPALGMPPRGGREYLVNIGLGRGTAQKRVTGGRWRRIELGEHLAGQVVELRGSPRLWP